MRMMLRIQIPTATGNAAHANGELAKVIAESLERLKPEAAYFFPQDGKRTAMMVIDLEDPSKIPSVSEPLFRKLDAEVTLTPVMTAEDLKKGLASLPS